MKKMTCALLLAGSCVLLASCGNDGSKAANNSTSQDSSSSRLSTQPTSSESTTPEEPSDSSQSSPESDLEQTINTLCQGKYMTDSSGVDIPDPDYLPLPDFESLPENSVFDVSWNTTEGTYAAGTSFLMNTDLADEPLLITALHYFGESDYIAGADLPDYVTGGELYDILKDGTTPDGSIKSVVPIPDAVSFGDVQTGTKDVAAFTVEDTSSMYAFPMASEPCQPGDMIYLAAYLSSENSYTYDDCLYPCVVVSDDGEEIYYLLVDGFVTNGASGGPLLNSKGEVVGIHIASSGSTRYGHSIQSIYEQLKNALATQE